MGRVPLPQLAVSFGLSVTIPRARSGAFFIESAEDPFSLTGQPEVDAPALVVVLVTGGQILNPNGTTTDFASAELYTP